MQLRLRDYVFPILITLVAVNLLVLFSIRPYEVQRLKHDPHKPERGGGRRALNISRRAWCYSKTKGGFARAVLLLRGATPSCRRGISRTHTADEGCFVRCFQTSLALGSPERLAYSMYAVNLLSLGLGMVFLHRNTAALRRGSYMSLVLRPLCPSMMAMLYDVPSPLSFFDNRVHLLLYRFPINASGNSV